MTKVTGTDPFASGGSDISRALLKGPTKRKRKLPHRMTYYLPKDLCEEIKEIAQEIEVPVSNVAHYALQKFVEGYKQGEIQLQPEVSVTRRKLV